MERLTKYSNDIIRNKAIKIIRKLSERNELNGDELAVVSAFCLIERTENKALKEYENLDKQGKLLKVPCKFGDNVFVKMKSGGYAQAEVRDFAYFHSCGFCIVATSDKFGKCIIAFSEFNKTVFLTQEEAEAAL